MVLEVQRIKPTFVSAKTELNFYLWEKFIIK